MLFLVNWLKKIFFLIVFTASTNSFLYAQCFEIESILVDACGSIEGENEMVRFRVGSVALNTVNMNVVWPNTTNPWLNICQNATTANAVAALNATIQGCGLLIEPTGGVLPANAQVLLITSTAIDVNANSFANLSDTLYVIFQCAGNTAGHFANWSATPGLRTLTISFSSPSGCNDVVTYDRTQLLNQNGTIGGSAAIRDGALVNFNAAGNPTYENFGCQAPFVSEYLVISSISSTSVCVGNTIQLYANASSSVNNLNWSSSNGLFNSTSNDTVIFTPTIPSPSNFYVFLTGTTSCGTISDSILITINQLPNVTANAIPSTAVCAGNSVILTGSGATTYNWDNGVTNGIAFNPPLGSVLYTVTGTDANNCTNSDTITLTTINCINLMASFVPSSLIICQDESITFTDNSTGTITNWNWTFNGGNPSSANTQGSHTITFNTPGIFNITLQITDTNGIDDTTIAVTVLPILTTTQNFNKCQGFSITVGNNTYNTTGNYTDTLLSLLSGCDSIVNTNLSINLPIPVTIIENDTTICENEFNNGMVLHAIGGTNLTWSTGIINVDSIVVTQSGIVTVTSNNNGCIVQDNFELFLERCLEPTIYIPNVFTPNNDGLNDIFEVKGSYIENIEISIFNRWGNELYTWKDINEGWDGKYKGNLVADGTYFYIINVVFENREKKNITGSITLLK